MLCPPARRSLPGAAAQVDLSTDGIRASAIYLAATGGRGRGCAVSLIRHPVAHHCAQRTVHQPVPDLIYRKATRRFYADKRLDNYARTTLKRARGRLWPSPEGEIHGLPCLLYRRARPPARRAALSGVCRSRTNCRPLPACGLAFAPRAEECRDLVLERLSRHGPASESDRRHGRDRDADGHRRRRHPQHCRQQSSAGRARARARRSAPQGSGAGFHLRLRLQRDRYFHAREG